MGSEINLQHAWDEAAALIEDQEATDEDNDAAEPYDIGGDFGLPAQVMTYNI